jgi:glycosyltransferase involved in cell wall biosynthesis
MWFCPYPVDVTRFRTSAVTSPTNRDRLRARFGLSPNDFVVAFNGKLIDRKRPTELADAIRAVGDPSVKALFVGTGPLEDEVKHRGGNRVRVTGFINQTEIPAILSLGDLGVMPSSYDPHPLAVTEFLALGTPVLVSDRIGCVGPDDTVRPGENGLVYPCGDVAALTAAIVRLRTDEALRQRMGRRATEIADTQTPEVAADVVVKCMTEVRMAGDNRATFRHRVGQK